MKIVALSLAIATVHVCVVRNVGAFSVPHSHTRSSTTIHRLNSVAVPDTEESDATLTNDNDNKNDTANKESKSYLDDGFVFGLDGSGIERPRGKVANIVVDGDSLETQPYQVIAVVGTFLAHFAFSSFAFQGMLAVNAGNLGWTSLQAVFLTVCSWVVADFGSGVLHWSVDNYGNGRTPIMGSIIAAFQGHHSAPWTITQRGFANNVYKLCIPFGVLPMAIISVIAGPFTTFFMTIFCAFEILSQEFHKWSHTTKGEAPAFVNLLQSAGLTVGRKPHALHHMEPYEGNYCIISGICNNALDQSGVFRRMEHLIYKLNGIESNAWKLDPALRERTLNGDYRFV